MHLLSLERLVLVDSLNDVLVLAESLSLVDVDALTMCLHLMSLKDSYLLIHLMTCLRLLSHSHSVDADSLVDVDSLNDVLALAAESERLVLVDSLNDVLHLLSLKDSHFLIHLMTCFALAESGKTRTF